MLAIRRRRKQKGKRKIVLQVAKQPMSAFMRFLADLRTETGYVSKTMKEQAAFTAEGGAKWRALSESERQVSEIEGIRISDSMLTVCSEIQR